MTIQHYATYHQVEVQKVILHAFIVTKTHCHGRQGLIYATLATVITFQQQMFGKIAQLSMGTMKSKGTRKVYGS